MDKQTASAIAEDWAGVAARDPEDPYRLHKPDHGYDRARTAVERQVLATVPEGAVVAAVDDDRKSPRVAAVEPAGRALYVIDFVPFDEDVDRSFPRSADVRATATIVGLDPARSRVVATSHWANRADPVRVTRWRFELGDDELVFTTETVPNQALPQDEAFAHPLCSAIAGGLPQQATELEHAASPRG
jgi:hypothetical protein